MPFATSWRSADLAERRRRFRALNLNYLIMKLTPHQILQQLGFDVPAEGVEINPNDLLLHETVLRMAGSSIDLARVPDAEFAKLHANLAALVASWRGEAQQSTTERSVTVERSIAAGVLALTFKHAGTVAQRAA